MIRNHRYTGDGGVDGRVEIDGRIWLIQAKRYAAAIRPDHVAAFEQLCRSANCSGLFIHTGRTGASSRDAVSRSGRVAILSGDALIAFVTGGPVALLPEISTVFVDGSGTPRAQRRAR